MSKTSTTFKHALLSGACALSLSLALATSAKAGSEFNGPMAFNSLDQSATLVDTWSEPFDIPTGYRQEKVADETDLDIYPDQDDLPDMNSQNETGRQAGRFLYHTHEVDNSGAVSVIDLDSGYVKVLAQATDGPDAPVGPTFEDFTSGRDLDGVLWTQQGTILIGEEDPLGAIYEISLSKNDPSTAVDVRFRGAIGQLCHEGIEQGPGGEIYVINEYNGGSIFRFVPDRRGDLSSGQLYALKLTGLTSDEQLYDGGANNDIHVGPFEWVAVNDSDASFPEGSAGCDDGHQAAADVQEATQFGRPEDLERIGSTLYVANTSEDRIMAIDLNKHMVSEFVVAGKNTPIEDDINPKGFNKPDNLAKGPDGRLWIVEDNKPSDIWVADHDRNHDGLADNVGLFASMKDSGAEGTGIYFGQDSQTLYVNIQHAKKELADGTWIITRK